LVSKRTFNWHWHYASNKKIVVGLGLWLVVVGGYCLGLGSGAYVGGLVLLVGVLCSMWIGWRAVNLYKI
jgi:hypothetical protein